MAFISKSFLMTELLIACPKFHFRKDLCDNTETSQLTDSLNHLNGLYLMLPFTEKKYA